MNLENNCSGLHKENSWQWKRFWAHEKCPFFKTKRNNLDPGLNCDGWVVVDHGKSCKKVTWGECRGKSWRLSFSQPSDPQSQPCTNELFTVSKIKRDKDKELPVSRACSAGGCRGAGWNSWRQNFTMKTLVCRLKERKTLKLNMIEVPSVFLPMLGRTDTERRSSLFIISSFCQTDVGLGKMHTGRQIRTFG